MRELGKVVLRFDSLASTNDVAKEMAASGAGEGLAILAAEQTAGRGSQGRSWASPRGEGLYFSLILRPLIKPVDSTILTLAAAIAVAETLIGEFSIEADIKWPNDILARGRKLCGILVECAIENDRLQYAVLGIGINVAQRSFPDEIAARATSIWLESGRALHPDEVLAPLLVRLQYWYGIAINSPGDCLARWEQLSSFARGRRVVLTTAGGAIEGTTNGLARSGALRVETADGQTREVISGEIQLKGEG